MLGTNQKRGEVEMKAKKKRVMKLIEGKWGRCV
jgi:hypothetical protein